jgi:hypothetical protein
LIIPLPSAGQLTSTSKSVGLDVEAAIRSGVSVAEALVSLLENSVFQPRLLATSTTIKAEVADESLTFGEGGGGESGYACGGKGDGGGEQGGELHDCCWMKIKEGKV